MSDLDVIQEIEKQIGEPLSQCELDTVMSGNSRCHYVLDAQQVIGLNLQNCKQVDLLLLKKLKNLLSLNLSLNQISQLSALRGLDKLTQLNLQKNNLSDLSCLKDLSSLTLLNLQDNKVSEIKPLKELKNLTVLNLQANQISELKYLTNLTNLTVLNLSSNHIKDLTPIRFLKRLISLNLSSNQIIVLDSLRDLADLLELDLRFNQVSKLDPLKKLKKIIRLYLSSNSISELEPLKELHDLTQLYLSSNQITDLTALAKLNTLTELDLRVNEIIKISALQDLTQLSWLYLENNQISDITPLENLTELSLLNLRNNKIVNIDAIKNLKKLTQLYLSNNKIQSLPKWIIDFNLKVKWNAGGDGISVMANPLKYPPPEIIRLGNLAIKNYFETLQQQQQRPLNEVKICFVGDSGVGKTSLRKLLIGENFAAQEPATQGIALSEWHYQNINAHCWDFGGNNKIQATHGLFFSEQCLYILVLDNRTERHEQYWLKKIEYLGGNVPILIVLNKSEEADSYDVDRKNLIRSYNGLQANSFFAVSCAQGLGLEELKQGIITALGQLTLVKKLWPESWIQVKNSIDQELKQQHYISAQLYAEICLQHGVKESVQQEQLAKSLHDLGVFVRFRKFNLSEICILESNWITKSLYKILCAPQLLETKGILCLKDLALILKANSENDYSYSVDHYRDLIKLMRNLELCFFLDKTSILVPQLLGVEEPEFEFSQDDILQFRIHYEYLDEAIIARFIVVFKDDIDGDSYWRNGVLLKNSSFFHADALMKVNYAERLITIQVSGEKRREYFAFIRRALLDIEATL